MVVVQLWKESEAHLLHFLRPPLNRTDAFRLMVFQGHFKGVNCDLTFRDSHRIEGQFSKLPLRRHWVVLEGKFMSTAHEHLEESVRLWLSDVNRLYLTLWVSSDIS